MSENKYYSKAIRLAATLTNDISTGCFPAGDYLPGEISLAARYSVSRATVRKAIDVLDKQGIVIKLNNRGTIPVRDIMSESRKAEVHFSQETNICAVWAGYSDAFIIGISNGIKRYAQETGINFQIIQNARGHERVLDELRYIDKHNINGIIVLPYSTKGYVDELSRLKLRDFPIVCVDRGIEGINLTCVDVDNFAGVYQATEKLVLTSKKPVWFFSPELNLSTQYQRYAGYCQAMLDCGFSAQIKQYSYFFPSLDDNPDRWEISKKLIAPTSAARSLLQQVSFPVAIMALNDYVASGIYTAAQESGLTIGKDILVWGFDDLPLANCLQPALSTVHQPREQIGYEAAKLLHDTIKGNLARPVTRTLSVDLIERESSQLKYE